MHRQVVDTKIHNVSLRRGGLPQVTLLFTAQLSDGRVMRRHQDHLLRRNRPRDERVASHREMEHRVPRDIPTPPSVESEASNAEAQSFATLGSHVTCEVYTAVAHCCM